MSKFYSYPPSADHWLRSSTHFNALFAFAVDGGKDDKCSNIYVGRAEHDGVILAATVVPSEHRALVSWDGKEYKKDVFEVLSGTGYTWVPLINVGVPHNAVVTGNNRDGKPMYIGRLQHEGNKSLTVVPFSGPEVLVREVLVRENYDTWEIANLKCPPTGAVVAGEDSDGSTIYVARTKYNGLMLPVKYIPKRGKAYVGSEGTEVHNGITVLIGENYTWVRPQSNIIPPNAVYTGLTLSKEPLFVGRAKYEGSLTPGLVSAGRDGVLISHNNKEVCVPDYEVLIMERQ